MATDPAVERRLTRLENDDLALYELLDEFRTETRTRFEQMDARFDRMDARFDGMDARFAGIDFTLAEILRRLPETA